MFAYAEDRGGQAPGWIVCTDVGGRSFVHSLKRDPIGKIDTVVWCCNLDRALRFRTIGDCADFLAVIPAKFEAYEEDPRFVDRHTL